MKFTANQIAELLNGEVVGDENVEVHTLSKIEDGEAGSLTFLSNPKYTPFIYSTHASVTIVDHDFVAEKEISTTLVKVANAYTAFSKLLEHYNLIKNNKLGIEAPISIADSEVYGDQIYIGAFTSIGENVKVFLLLLFQEYFMAPVMFVLLNSGLKIKEYLPNNFV